MQVTHAGYRDPNNLKFEDITVLGVPHPPVSVSVTHVAAETVGNSTSTVSNTSIQYDEAKKVNTHMFIDIVVHKCKIKAATINFFSCQGELPLQESCCIKDPQ